MRSLHIVVETLGWVVLALIVLALAYVVLESGSLAP